MSPSSDRVAAVAPAASSGVLGRALFSVWNGVTVAGSGGLFRVTNELGEMRQISSVIQLPGDSVVLFCRGIRCQEMSGRFLGAFRIARDQTQRKGYHGFGTAIMGRTPESFDAGLKYLTALSEVDESKYAQLVHRTDIFVDEPNTPQPEVQVYKSGNVGLYTVDAESDQAEIWRRLWNLSWSGGNYKDILASDAFPANVAGEVLPAGSPPDAGKRVADARPRHIAQRSDLCDPPGAEGRAQGAPLEQGAPAGSADLTGGIEHLSAEVARLSALIDEQNRKIDRLSRSSGKAGNAAAGLSEATPRLGTRMFANIEPRPFRRLLVWSAAAVLGLLAVAVIAWLALSGPDAHSSGPAGSAEREVPLRD